MKKYIVCLKDKAAKEPTLAKAVKETGVLINILVADIDYTEGQALISVEGDDADTQKILGYFQSQNVEVSEIEGAIIKDDDKCIDCQSCYGVCPTKAITIEENEMVLDNRECISCLACIAACPTKSLSERKI